MTYGCMSAAQREALRDVVRGREVIDLGCGDLAMAATMIGLGAARVVAVDKDPVLVNLAPDKIQVVQGYFADYDGPVPGVAFLSWPGNWPMPGLLDILARAEIVVYLGSNTDGSACGWPDLFKALGGRRLISHVPHRSNTLLIYGSEPGEPRKLTGEEVAALHYSGVDAGFLTFDNAEYIAASAELGMRIK